MTRQSKQSRNKSSSGGGPAADPAGRLLAWYDLHARRLPWRAMPGTAPNPYHVFLSEIMLQQTTVAAVMSYFNAFIERWPRLDDLAAADLDSVLQAWAGLGYYRRARALHAAARHVVGAWGGVWRGDEKELLSLPGLGPYTAAAMRAIAFDQPANVVDGNVERVVCRYFALRDPLPAVKKEIRAMAARLLPAARHGDYAQALMDLGATVCTPRGPKCGLCPLASDCAAAGQDWAESLPARLPPRPKPKRSGVAFVLMDGAGRVYIRKRADQGLFAGMMEVPSTSWDDGPLPDPSSVRAQARDVTGRDLDWTPLSGTIWHSFTHFDLEMGVWVGDARSARLSGGKWLAWDDLAGQALPSLMRKILAFARRSVKDTPAKARKKTTHRRKTHQKTL